MSIAAGVLATLASACGFGPPPPAAPPADGASTTDPWSAARARGVDFWGIGQEPGWLLEIDEGVSMRLLYDYGERSATVTAGPPATGSGRRTYAGVNETDSLRVVIEDTPCHDVMSGEPFPSTVAVSINGRALTGCGRRLR